MISNNVSRRELTRETRRIEELRERIAKRTLETRKKSTVIDTDKLKKDIKKWSEAKPTSVEVLCYGIIDSVIEPNPGTMKILDNNTDQLISIQPKTPINQHEAFMVKKYASQVLQSLFVDNPQSFYEQFKYVIREAKNIYTNNNNTPNHDIHNNHENIETLTRKTKKRVIKIINVYRHQLKRNGKNMLLSPMNFVDFKKYKLRLKRRRFHENCEKNSFLKPLIGPLFNTLLRGEDDLEIMWGETKLKAAQNMDSDDLDDGHRRCSSANIDGKITTTKADVEIALFEVSGPPLVRDYSHFIGDRKKLALNMKKILHDIINRHTTGKKSY
ncbi:hypothetical protein INT45_011458 [Circinella minor]|uniref:Uncharacterized protein n=1 Tax=Circinella minor TaxID=1195481 RepID=A0A8H7SAB2_9FUNG|nr:hypothetical protein INT45_011458 [Circinella minor]